MEVGEGKRGPGLRTLGTIGTLAAGLFITLFRFGRLGPLDFWWWISADILTMIGLSLAAERGYARRLEADARSRPAKKIALGVLSAAVLYAVFAGGKAVVFKVLPFAPAAIADVYRLRQGASLLRILLLLGLVIGPGEELFWRGFLQDRTGLLLGPDAGLWLTALLYALVHVASGNIIFVLAAAVCGLYWGLTYRIFRSPLLNAVSHTVWDVAVFVLFPL